MKRETILRAAAITGGLAVAIGAFGAHAFKPKLIELGRVDTFELAVRYQFYHAFALLAVALVMQHIDSKKLRWSGLFFLLGIVFFSGSLYALCLTANTVFGAVTPIGGIFFIIGWALLAGAAYKK